MSVPQEVPNHKEVLKGDFPNPFLSCMFHDPCVLCMLGGAVRKVHLFKSDLEIERVIRPAFCHSGTGTVGGNEKEKQKAEMKNGYTFLEHRFIATSNFSRVPTVICTC